MKRVLKLVYSLESKTGLFHPDAELDERWTKIMGRKVWRNVNTGETWIEEK